MTGQLQGRRRHRCRCSCQPFSAFLLAIGIANGWQAAARPVTASGLIIGSSSAAVSGVRSSARSLQQEVTSLEAEDITEVTTAEELVRSLEEGARDIVITRHIDLTGHGVPLRDNNVCPSGCETPLPLITSRSVRGNCTDDTSEPPAGVELQTLLARDRAQCLLVVAGPDMMQLESTQIWIDNLFLKLAIPSVGFPHFGFPILVTVPPAATAQGERYLTRMTLEGDGDGSAAGLWADSDTFIEDSVFSLLGGPGTGISSCTECRSALISKAHVTVDGCRFEEPLRIPGAISVLAVDGGSVLLLGSSVPSTAADVRIVKEGPVAEIYSDDPQHIVSGGDGEPSAPAAEAHSIPRDPAPGERFLRGSDSWLVQIRQMLESAEVPASPVDTGSAGDGSGGSSSSSGTGLIAAAVAAVLAAVCC